MNIALILAGGTGTRLGGDIPKQYLDVDGKPVISYCLETFLSHGQIDKIQIVAEDMWQELIGDWVKKHEIASDIKASKFQGFSKPGMNRQLSIWNGLQDILHYSKSDDVVIIHDAARPLVSEKIITDCLNACVQYDGALTILPVKDTVYYGTEGKIESLLDRDHLMAGQAPEAFRLGLYCQANEKLLPQEILKINGSTEPAILAGMNIGCVDGEEINFKITTKADLERFKQLVTQKDTEECV